MKVYVLRIGHRVSRDKRITTHVGLIARALGADGIILSGERDESVVKSLRKVVELWGGPFEISYVDDWLGFMRRVKREGWEIIHLTVYGLPIQDVIEEIRGSGRDKLIVVGASKVPGVVYQIADWNVAVSSQPHSECGSLAVFLDRLFQGKELEKEFKNWKLKVIPQARGKKVIKAENEGCEGSDV